MTPGKVRGCRSGTQPPDSTTGCGGNPQDILPLRVAPSDQPDDIPDAYHAGFAIETGSAWITTDRGFARYPDLRWRHPLD
ncbi:MAG TPA: hypothetical protein VMN60_08090 [Longimicrobiales bacterium]|nr:hypothetical protein [Longimicrobiales bacterium]